MQIPAQRTCVHALLFAGFAILGERIAAADTVQLVFDVQLNTLSNDVTGEVSSITPFSEKNLTFDLNDTVIGHVVPGGGLEKRTEFQPPRVPLFSPTPFTSSLLATNPSASSVPISETYLKQQFNPNNNQGGTFFAIGDFKSFSGPDPSDAAIQDFWLYNIYIAVDSPPDPTVPGSVYELPHQALRELPGGVTYARIAGIERPAFCHVTAWQLATSGWIQRRWNSSRLFGGPFPRRVAFEYHRASEWLPGNAAPLLPRYL